MKSAWSDSDAKDYVARYAQQGVNEDLALRVYTSRLLGRDPALVLHGGGNTSVKTTVTDALGDAHEVLCVKGSGWDMGDIEPAGLPAVRLAPLRRLRDLDALSDEEMVNQQRIALLDSTAPNPSVETLLHAFLPHKFVDHTHANAVLSLVDQENSRDLHEEVYGGEMAFIDWVMPGFDLARVMADAYDRAPQVKGAILDKHGIFTFGDTAREAYERMIDMVSRAEARIARTNGRARPALRNTPEPALAAAAPVLRGAVAESLGGGAWRRMVMEFRGGDSVRAYVDRPDLAEIAGRGVVTPDHIIRTKNTPLVLPPADSDAGWSADTVRRAVADYADRYREYFARQTGRRITPKAMLDAMPRIVLAPGLGLFALGKSKKDARVAADVAEATMAVISDAEAFGRYAALPEDELFCMEYWSLEQAKLGKAVEKPLQRQIAAITGGAGTIGAATAKLLAANGAEVAVLDRDGDAARRTAAEIGGAAIGLECDVTDAASVQAAFHAVVAEFGGLDILVSNAGAAWQGKIGEVDAETLRQSFELNFFGHQAAAQAAIAIMLAQGTGGALLFNASKQAINPGPEFGPYGLPKAATLFLSRQYAVDYGPQGIRSNAVNADRIRSGILTDGMIASRSKARGLSEADYMGGNLLGLEVTADDVAEAFLHQALALKTTGGVTTVDGGNIAAALR